jgi:phospholipid-binding lipoprotein MlaA
MKPLMTISVSVVIACLFETGLLGCASQPTKPATVTAPKSIHQSEPLVVASATSEDIRPEEQPADEDLLKDDWDDFEDSEALDDNQSLYTVADPLEPVNRAMFYLNDKLYFWVFKPIAMGYRSVTPQAMRVGIRNFFSNLLSPVRLVNDILQGKGQAAEAEFAKFIYNSTVGVLGFGDPAKAYPALNPEPEDLGQTMASYGIGDGFYIVWPVLGASTLRDTIGDVGDGFLNPVSYVEPIETYLTLQAVDTINDLSFYLGDYETFKKAALDPYESMRNAYIQLRQSKIKK